MTGYCSQVYIFVVSIKIFMYVCEVVISLGLTGTVMIPRHLCSYHLLWPLWFEASSSCVACPVACQGDSTRPFESKRVRAALLGSSVVSGVCSCRCKLCGLFSPVFTGSGAL